MLTDNGTITEENMKTPCDTLDAISTTIKAEKHFWAHRDELISDVRQQPNEGIHALSQHISSPHYKVQVPPHLNPGDAEDHSLTTCSVLPRGQRLGSASKTSLSSPINSLLSHCKLLESRCKQY